MLVDNGSSVDVMFYDAFLIMSISPALSKEVHGPSSGFSGDSVPVKGTIMLPMIAGQAPWRSLVCLTFMIAKAPSTYNAILGGDLVRMLFV